MRNIIHFNVDKNTGKYLSKNAYSFSLNQSNLSKILNKKNIEAVSIKYQSTVDEKVLDHLPNLKLVVTRTVGIDHLDLDLFKKKGIVIYHIPDYGSHNIAEHTLALLLAGARNITQANEYTHRGKFAYDNFIGIALNGKTLGVIGTGKIGLVFIKLAKAFNLKIIAFDVFKNEKASQELGFKYVNLDELLQKSDFISIHVPLLPQTKHMISGDQIKKMKNDVILVNTSRGSIIDTKALVRYITKFKAICLDVLEDEKNFSKNDPLLKLKNVVITPHIAFYTDDSIKRIAKETENCVIKFINNNKEGRII